ncbi:MAG: dockerin type I repeat-containing protein [Acutalibacteraceae bacterium]|nr:dockerin type I repeat-containing protein [Acutalibacteraceae bacterium]
MYIKKFIGILIVLSVITMLLFAVVSVSAADNEVDIDMSDELCFISGDVNGDGKVNSDDLVTISRVQAKWDVKYLKVALDTNGDGVFNLKDIVRLSQKLAGWNVEISNVPFEQ